METLKFIFSSFWIWLGFMLMLNLLLYFIINFLFRCYNRTLRHRVLMKHGYPPPHCDADGDIAIEEEEEDGN